ncbi:DUF4150 domain-containing protein [uncultured Thiodictyon sp.]|uniref:DUF4150 domain-containing protein n=1 Tax=uncultured Thiodictyon sp. TaxID=1846217 RepID=UPI0025D62FE1|nr:DUF4150 domain-containing protein [uncultured Thiodictyon sp.]
MPDIEGGCKRDFRVISLVPDVCKSPTVPVPYPIVAVLQDSVRTAATVHFSGKGSSDTFTLNSRITTLSGDEPGTGGGVISGVNRGWSRPINGSATVRAQGFGVVQEKVSLFWMNCAGPEGPGNTVGMLIFDRRSTSAAVGPDGLSPAELAVAPETEAEAGFLDGMLGQIGLSTADLGDIFEWGKQAYALSQVDWSNPAGVLGGIAGLAGIPGLGNLGEAAGIAQLGYNLATMDWSDPAQVLGALGGVAGLRGLSDIARLASLGGKACAIVTTDWTDPASLMRSVGIGASLAGYGCVPGIDGTAAQPFAIATADWRNPGAMIGSAMNLAGMLGLQDGLLPNPNGPKPSPAANSTSTGPRVAFPSTMLSTPHSSRSAPAIRASCDP